MILLLPPLMHNIFLFEVGKILLRQKGSQLHCVVYFVVKNKEVCCALLYFHLVDNIYCTR